MKKIIKYIITCVLLIIISILTYFVISNVVAKKNNTISSFFGFSVSYVPSESMEPTIEKGSTVLFKKDDYSNAKENDIIVYKNDELNIYVIHRIKYYENNKGFVMQGDNNKTVDTNKDGSILYVTQNNYVGKYLKTVSVFSINSTLSRTIIFILAILTTFFIMVTEIFSIIRNVKDNKKENNVKLDDKEKELLRKEILEELKKEMNNKDKK